MDMNVFMERLLSAAREAGMEAAEIYYVESDSFNASAREGQIASYNVSSDSGLSLRGVVQGRMGYASTQAYDDEAIGQLVRGVLESAALTETEEQDEIFAGEATYPTLPEEPSDLDSVSAEDKLNACLTMERAVKAADERIWKVQGSNLVTERRTLHIRNSYGLDLRSSGSAIVAYTQPIAREAGDTAAQYAVMAGHRFADLHPEQLAREAAEKTVSMLHAAPVEAGDYRVVLHSGAMRDLLSTFSGIFSAENAQQKLSLYAGKEGTEVASGVVTVVDDPLLRGGFGSCTFDAEGSAARTKNVIERGVLRTLLHSRKTARKQGVQTTGNASRPSYTAPVHVAPTNLFLKPGEQTPEELMAQVGDGLLITEVTGLHAGANPVSGDFSLLSKGYVIEGGRRGRPVEQITVAGNFYQLLRDIRCVGCDLDFEGGEIGAPSVDAGVLKISGK